MFDLKWEEERAIYIAVGAVIINWGIAESCISQACDILINAGGHKSQRLPPVQVTRRLKLIKACCKDYPDLSHLRAFATSLISDSKNLIRERDILVHGAISGFDRQARQIKFVRLDAGEIDYSMEGFAFRFEGLAELPGAAAKIGTDWIKFVEGLHAVRDGPNGLKNRNGV